MLKKKNCLLTCIQLYKHKCFLLLAVKIHVDIYIYMRIFKQEIHIDR